MTHSWRFRKTSVIGLVVVAVALACLALCRREPRYNGKPLSYWLDQLTFDAPFDPPVPEPQLALQTMGTKALPHLLRRLTAKNSRIKEALREFDETHGKMNLGLKRAEPEVEKAIMGYMALGEIAAPAVRDLVALVNKRNETASDAAISVLPFLGSEGIRATMRLISSTTNSFAKSVLIFNLAAPVFHSPTNSERHKNFQQRYRHQIEPMVQDLVQELTCFLNDDDQRVASTAVRTLGRLRVRPELIIPALTNLTADERLPLKVRIGSITAAGNFGKEANNVAPFLRTYAENTNSGIRAAVSNALSRINGGGPIIRIEEK